MGRALFGILTCVAIFVAESVESVEVNPVLTDSTAPAIEDLHEHFLVKLRDAATGTAALQDLAIRTNLVFEAAREISLGLYMLQVRPAAGEHIAQSLARLRADPLVEYVDADRWRFPSAVPDDPGYLQQWFLQATEPAGTDAVTAWDISTGRSDVVIAELDTGVRFDHPDLLMASASGRLLPGYDFVSSAAVANDSDGRDADASDPGDWVSAADAQSTQFYGCSVADSSWHGTRVAGILGAQSNNGVGIAGMTWAARILPVRVLGKCGGLDSDILDALRWAAGLHVNGVPDNVHPAQIINLSFGSPGSCGRAVQTVLNEVMNTGATVIAAGGNDGAAVDSPANCAGVAGIAGLRHSGTKSGFSNLGPAVALAAPGGNCVSSAGPCAFSLDTTTNTGTTVPATNSYTGQVYANLGTSFSAPIVAGIAALMTSVNANLTSVQVIARLKEGAKAFPAAPPGTNLPTCHVPAGSGDLQTIECVCTTQTCGAGMANAPGALAAALRPVAAIAVPTNIAAGQNVSVSGVGSGVACNRSIATYAWTNISDPNGAVHGADTSTATIAAPSSGSVTLRLTVTDDSGRTDSANVTISSNSAVTAAPAAANTRVCTLPSIAVSPTSLSIQAGGSAQTFAARVNSDTDTAVGWYVNSTPGGDSRYGTISTSGSYTPPASVPTPDVVTVKAVWISNPTKYATAQVTISAPVSVSITPILASVAVGSTAAFTATVAHADNTAVEWSVNGLAGGDASIGTISSTGIYEAPASAPSPANVTITAVSASDSTKSASATATVTASPPSSGGSSAGGSGAAPAPSSGGGGGGAVDLLTLIGEACALGVALVARRNNRERYARRCAASSQDFWALR